MSASVLLNVMKRVGNKRSNARLADHLIAFLSKRLINSIKQEYQCFIH